MYWNVELAQIIILPAMWYNKRQHLLSKLSNLVIIVSIILIVQKTVLLKNLVSVPNDVQILFMENHGIRFLAVTTII